MNDILRPAKWLAGIVSLISRIPMITPGPRLTQSPTGPSAPPSAGGGNMDNLLSAVASLSGTMAAILGGFVLAALLSISSERNSMGQLLVERRAERERLETELRERRQYRDNAWHEMLMAWLRPAFRSNTAPPEASDVLSRLSRLGLDPSDGQINQIASEFVRLRTEADDLATAWADRLEQDIGLRSFTRWLAVLPVRPGIDLELLHDAFDREIASIERRERLGSARRGGLMPGGSMADREIDVLAAAESALRRWPNGPQSTTVAQLELNLQRLEVECDRIDAELSAWQLPSHLGFGIALFCFMVGIGVIYPISQMPASSATHVSAVDLTVKLGVGLQIAAIAGYMVMLARSVRRADDRPRR